MRRSASEIIRNLEMRVARLERKASTWQYQGPESSFGLKIPMSFVDKVYALEHKLFEKYGRKEIPQELVERYLRNNGGHIVRESQIERLWIAANEGVVDGDRAIYAEGSRSGLYDSTEFLSDFNGEGGIADIKFWKPLLRELQRSL